MAGRRPLGGPPGGMWGQKPEPRAAGAKVRLEGASAGPSNPEAAGHLGKVFAGAEDQPQAWEVRRADGE